MQLVDPGVLSSVRVRRVLRRKRSKRVQTGKPAEILISSLAYERPQFDTRTCCIARNSSNTVSGHLHVTERFILHRSTLRRLGGIHLCFSTLVWMVDSEGNPDEQFHLILPREYWARYQLWAILRPARVSNGGGNPESLQTDIGSHTNGSSVVRWIR